MSKHHHHHPHEGHADGNHSPKRKALLHDWRFYAAGGLIFIALLIYLLSGDLAWRPHV